MINEFHMDYLIQNYLRSFELEVQEEEVFKNQADYYQHQNFHIGHQNFLSLDCFQDYHNNFHLDLLDFHNSYHLDLHTHHYLLVLLHNFLVFIAPIFSFFLLIIFKFLKNFILVLYPLWTYVQWYLFLPSWYHSFMPFP